MDEEHGAQSVESTACSLVYVYFLTKCKHVCSNHSATMLVDCVVDCVSVLVLMVFTVGVDGDLGGGGVDGVGFDGGGDGVDGGGDVGDGVDGGGDVGVGGGDVGIGGGDVGIDGSGFGVEVDGSDGGGGAWW